MNAAVSAQHDSALTARSENRDAKRWIERQLRWERTLGALRGRENHPTHERKAA
jgi:hypothetical protein